MPLAGPIGGEVPRLLTPLLVLIACAVLTPSASAIRVATLPQTMSANPADALRTLTPDPETYDRATGCRRKPQPGMTALVEWLEHNAEGSSWGTFRCERWDDGGASLHAEGRAVDWHLDSRVPEQRSAGKRLIALLLATDAAGTPHALARRMGVQELIWDCSYWSAGMRDFSRYSACFTQRGQRRRRVDPTTAHLDHLHIGISKAGAARRTSFWRQGSRAARRS